MESRKREGGFAVVYGLAMLFLATLGGMSLMYITEKDSESSSDYSKVRDAAIAARTALSAFEGQLQKNPEHVVKLINAYCSDHSKKWFFTSTVGESVAEKKISLWNGPGASSFSARIMNFDTSSYIIQVEGIGYGGRGGKKKAVGIYKIDGMKRPSPVPRHALYLGSGFGNLDKSVVIDGDVFAGNNNMINANGTITIKGNFKTGTGLFGINGPIIVNGKAFIRGDSKFQNYGPTINGDIGIKGSMELNSVNMNVIGKAFVNQNITGAGKMIVSGSDTAKYTSSLTDISKIQATNKKSVSSPIDLETELKMKDVDDDPPSVVSNLESYITSTGGTIYSPSTAGLNFDTPGWGLAAAYTSKSKWNDFLVIKCTSAMNVNQSGGQFNNKVIWIFDGSLDINVNCKWYSSGVDSKTFIYLKSGAKFNDFGFKENETFRGVIYSESNSQSKYKFNGGSTFEGSIIHTGTDRTQFNDGGGSPANINYNENVISEFENLGILTGNSSTTQIVMLEDIKLRPEMLGIHY